MKDLEKIRQLTIEMSNQVNLSNISKDIINKKLTVTIRDNVLLRDQLSQSLILSKNKSTAVKLKNLIEKDMEICETIIPEKVIQQLNIVQDELGVLVDIINQALEIKPIHSRLADQFGIPSTEFQVSPYITFDTRFGNNPPNQKELREIDLKLFKSLEYWIRKMQSKYKTNIRMSDIVRPSNKTL